MPNIFDGINKMSNDELIEQVAFMETMNRLNLSKPLFFKAVKKAVNFINFVGNKMGKDPNVREPEVKEIWTVLEETKEELKSIKREELNERLREILIEKSRIKSEIPSDDELSVAVIEECCKMLGIPPKMTPGKKADIIFSKIENDDVNDEYEEETEENDIKVIDAPNVSLLRMGKKFDRELLAKLVYTSMKAYGQKFSPLAENMPSFKSHKEKEEEAQREKAVKDLREELASKKEKLKEIEEKVHEDERKIKKEEFSLNNLIKIQKKASDEIVNLENSKEKLSEEKAHLDELLESLELERVKASLNELDEIMKHYEEVKLRIFDIKSEISSVVHEITYKHELIDNCINDTMSKQKYIRETETSKNQSEELYKKKAEEYNEKLQLLKSIESEKKESILIKWKDAFDRITFEKDDLKNVVRYSSDELVEIEKCIYEINNTEDPSALSGGIIKDGPYRYDYMEITNEEGFRFEIWYEVYEGAGRNIHIVEIE